jgi:hypothetical protein
MHAKRGVLCTGFPLRRMLWWAGIHRPAAAAACQSLFYGFYSELTELSANDFRLLFAG